MFKAYKFLSSMLFVVAPASACFVFITSCGKTDYSDYQSEHVKFINERTFFIITKDSATSAYMGGTAWIFKKSADGDYTYYLGTNVHVAASFSSSTTEEMPMEIGYNPTYSQRKWLNLTKDYLPINNYELLGEEATTRPTKSDWNLGSEFFEWDVDFDVFKVTFGSNPDDIKNNDPFVHDNDSPLLDRLNNLNNYATQHDGTITQFAKSNYQYKSGMSIHVAGFPFREDPNYMNEDFPLWTSYSTTYDFNNVNYNTTNNPIMSTDEGIRFKDEKPINIIGKVMGYKPNSSPELTGGSSGSMVVDDNNIVVAINFFGETDGRGNATQNCGLFLNTNDDYFGKNYKYEIFNDWFQNLL